jgi:hypothetical protein
MIYINMKDKSGKVETIDCVDRNDFTTNREYRKEISNVLKNYRLANLPVYTSQRATKD